MPGYVATYLQNRQREEPLDYLAKISLHPERARPDDYKRFGELRQPDRSFEQGENYVRNGMRHLTETLPGFSDANTPELKLRMLREVSDLQRREINDGQRTIGSAWKDPDFTRGARHALNRFYLETKKQMGLSHLPELPSHSHHKQHHHSTQLNRDYGCSY